MSEVSRIVVGLDVGDRTVDMCVLECASGKVLSRAKVPCEREAMRRVFGALPKQARVVLESGTHSPWIARLLHEVGLEPFVADARQIKLIAQGKRKSDRRDAELLARLGASEGLLARVDVREETLQRHRSRLKLRHGLVQSRTRLINEVQGVVKSLGHRIPRCSVEAFPLRAWNALPQTLREDVLVNLLAIRKLTRAIRRHDRELEELAERTYPEVARLRQVSRVGPLTSLALVLVIGKDPQRFRNGRLLAAYLGLTPGRNQSGALDPDVRITSTGDSYVRQLLVSAAHGILTRGPDSDLRRWGLALAARYGPKKRKRAAVAVARKLAVLLYRLLVSGKPYEPLRNAERKAREAQEVAA